MCGGVRDWEEKRVHNTTLLYFDSEGAQWSSVLEGDKIGRSEDYGGDEHGKNPVGET